MLDNMNSGYDAQFLVLKPTNKALKELDNPSSNLIRGLIAFNVDTMLQKQTQKQVKINLYHVSTIDETKLE
jgi:hypothetical protein